MIEIVRLRGEHLGLLKRFFEAINTSEYRKDFSPHPFNEDYAKFVCNYKGSDFYFSILLNNEEIIGYGMLRGWDEGYEIPSIGLCVLKKYQGSGLGRLILNFLETASRLKGCSKVMLKVRKGNVVAKKLYESQKYAFKEYNEEFLIGYKELLK
jgi:ribosomal protein S18 acetylase RimI-like enzyme